MEQTAQHRLFRVLVLLSLLLLMSAAVLADSGTTTGGTAYKSLSANTQMYVVTSEPYGDYVNYGAINEPDGGVYYGRVSLGGTLPDGRYGSVNSEALADETIVAQYYSLTNDYSLQYWSYLYKQYIEDGSHGLLVQLNFENEAADCTPAVNGEYDAKLVQDFQYLAVLSCPVFIRIGGEINVWTQRPSADSFISAYRHIAELARTYAPNVALVYSVSFSSSYKVDMDSYYPGDDYVDWIGVSLYYNRYTESGIKGNDRFFGVGTYGDPMLNIQQTVNLSRMHQKPIIVTEGGSAYTMAGEDTSSFAAERVEKAYNFLNMVYPEIKAIVYSDTNFVPQATSFYQLTGNSVMTAAYRKSVASNPTLLHSLSAQAPYYTKISAYTGAWSGTMTLTAYTYSSSRLTAEWYVDDEKQSTVSDYPYSFTLNVDALTADTHTVKVRFSNGVSRSYTFVKAGNGWRQNDGQWYYYQKGKAVTGWKRIGGSWYYFSADGSMKTGWQYSFRKWYYLSSSGAMQTGWLSWNGSWYYFTGSGAMQTGWLSWNGSWYYFTSSGAMKTEWLRSGGSWYYLDSSGAMQTGWTDIGETRYYFDPTGAMVTGELQEGCTLSVLDDSGALLSQTTRHTWDAGIVTTEAGCETPGEMTYTCSVCGETKTEEIPAPGHLWRAVITVPTAQKAGYTTHSCMRCGSTLVDSETAADTAETDGWTETDGQVFYYAGGTALTGWIEVDGKLYYLNGDGVRQSGWVGLEYGTWYLDEAGVMQTGWLTVGEATYYLDDSGRMLTGSHMIDGTEYQFDEAGVLITEKTGEADAS